MTIQTFEQGTLITLSKPFDTRAKTLYLAYGIGFAIGGAFILASLLDIYLTIVGTIVVLAFGTALLVASYRFGRSSLLQEHLFIDEKKLILMEKGFKIKRKVFDLASVTQFRFLAKPEMARHSLTGENFDYFGFQMEQQVINEMHGDNRLAFDYNGRTVTFGKNIYSWDFDEILRIMISYGYIANKPTAETVLSRQINM